MSHFNLGVIVNNEEELEDMLAPYDENLQVKPYINRTKQEIIETAKNLKERYTKEFKERGEIEEFCQRHIKAKTDEELYNAEREKSYDYDKEGNELTTYNPKSKWDWWIIGGRWQGDLLTKEDNCDIIGETDGKEKTPKGYKRCDGAKIKDICFNKEFDAKSKEAKRFWELYVEGNKPKNKEEEKIIQNTFFKKEYYIEQYGNKESYIKYMANFYTYALLDENGWHAQGVMGFWGMDNSTKESIDNYFEYLNKAIKDPKNQDKYLIIVDCHI